MMLMAFVSGASEASMPLSMSLLMGCPAEGDAAKVFTIVQ